VTVSLVLLVIMAALYAAGLYLMLERSLTRVLIGFLLAANATSLLIVIVAGPAGTAPIADEGASSLEMADPLPQALTLTAIVITFAVSAFLLGLIYRSWRLANRDVVADDRDTIAMREGPAIAATEGPAAGAEDELATEFGPGAEALRDATETEAGR